jgi:hypothetical protein
MIGIKQKDRDMKSITMVVDLQYGSTGKGLIAGWLAEHEMTDSIFTASRIFCSCAGVAAACVLHQTR